MHVSALDPTRAGEAIALWEAAGLTRPWNDALTDLQRALDGPASTILAIIDVGRLVGTVMVGHDGHRGWVYYLATDPARRHEGIGRALMRAAESWLVERNVPKIQCMVRTTNVAVVDFYQRLGYVPQDCLVVGRRLGDGDA